MEKPRFIIFEQICIWRNPIFIRTINFMTLKFW